MGGIVFTTRGWDGAQILVHHAAGDDLYIVDGDVQNAGVVAVAFRDWLDHISRPWSGVVPSVAMEVLDDGSRLYFHYTTASDFDFSGATPAWQSRISVWSNAVGSIFGTTRGSCSAVPGSLMWERWDTETGARNRRGSWRVGHPTLSHRRPTVSLEMDLYQAMTFNEGLRLAPDPRRAYVFDEVLDDYRMCVIGEARLQPLADDDVTKVVGTLEVLGEVGA